MTTDYRGLIQQHQIALDAEATEKTKLWWERYLRGVIPFRGIGIPRNRQLLAEWRTRNGIDRWPYEEQLTLALEFIKEQIAEDKLAGILFIQNYLYNKLPWEMLLGRYSEIYDRGMIFDWNTCDWFCVRVLGPMVKGSGERGARAIISWKDAPYLWKARSSVVPFVGLAGEASYYPYIKEGCATLIGREERFSKTAVGWILHSISRHDRRFVLSFVEDHLDAFSVESLANALRHFEKELRNGYLRELKRQRQELSPPSIG